MKCLKKYWPENLQDSERIVNFALAKAKWFHVRVVRYRSAKPFTPVRIWLEPPRINKPPKNRRLIYVSLNTFSNILSELRLVPRLATAQNHNEIQTDSQSASAVTGRLALGVDGLRSERYLASQPRADAPSTAASLSRSSERITLVLPRKMDMTALFIASVTGFSKSSPLFASPPKRMIA